MIATCVAGCDISSRWLDLCILSEAGPQVTRLGNDAAGQAAVVAMVRAAQATRVVLEASGGYEAAILAALWAADQPVALVPAQRVRHFARAGGQLAKTDRIDAQVLALYAARIQPALTPPVSETQRVLKGLVGRRRTLVRMRADEAKRLHQTAVAAVQASIKAVIEGLTAQIAGLTTQIRQAIAALREGGARDALLRSMPGVGPATAAVLLADLPELGRLSKGQVAALAGLAPHARQSGSWKGKSFICGGRKPVRDALYMAATSAVFRTKTRFASQYQTLRNTGKPHKLALVAVMRKMIVTLNAMVKTNKTYQN